MDRWACCLSAQAAHIPPIATQVQEIVRLAPRDRQTMLFSATMTEDVEKLVKVSLRQPVRLAADAAGAAPDALSQEIIRLKVRLWRCLSECKLLEQLFAAKQLCVGNIAGGNRRTWSCGLHFGSTGQGLYASYSAGVIYASRCLRVRVAELDAVHRVRRRRRARRRCCWRCAPRPSRAAAPSSSSAPRHATAHAVSVIFLTLV